MTPREIIERALRLEPTPRLPVSLLSAGAWTLNRHGLTLERALSAGPERLAEVIADTNEAAAVVSHTIVTEYAGDYLYSVGATLIWLNIHPTCIIHPTPIISRVADELSVIEFDRSASE